MASLGVEYGAKFVLTGPDGTRVVFNDETDSDFVGELNPESSGLDAPELREDSSDRVEDDGAIFGNFYAGKRPIVLQGTIRATSATQRNERVGKLKRASNAKTGNAILTWEPQGLGQQVQLELRRQQPIRITGPFVKQFQLAMVSADSRIVSTTTHSASTTGVEFETTASISPTSVASEDAAVSATVEGSTWANPENAKTANNVYATTTPTMMGAPHAFVAMTDYLVATYSLSSIPSNARILKIVVSSEMKLSANQTQELAGYPRMLYKATAKGLASAKGETERLSPEPTATEGTIEHEFDPKSFWPETTREAITKALREEAKIGVGFFYWWRSNVTVPTFSVDWLPIHVLYSIPAVLTVTNNGDAPAAATFKVTGPITNPVIENEATHEQLRYNGTILKGETVTFNSGARTAMSSMFGNVYGSVEFPTSWLKVLPGSNTIALATDQTGSSKTETKLEVFWRDSWE